MTKENYIDPRDPRWDPTPKDDKTWWQRSHCGPGTIDGSEMCECGKTKYACAQYNTKHIHLFLEMDCGCAGFWCPKCKVFYAQDVCWETYDDEYETLSGKKVELHDDGYIYCGCGERLYKKVN